MSNDNASDGDLPIIDVRSPAERATEAGQAGLARLQERLRDSHLDIAALLWMVFIAGLLAVEVYSAFRSNDFAPLSDTKGWMTATLLAQTGNVIIIFGSMIGIALAAWADTGPARAALVLAVVLGIWAAIANVIGIAVVFHTRTGISFSLTSLSENRAVATVGQLMLCGLGLVVALVGAMLLRPPPVPEVAPAG